MKKIIIIAGPTGVGKSDFAEILADKLDGEIINADQGQLYEPLSIGTAKPDWKNKTIKHHLFDLITEPRNYSTAEYRTALYEKITQLQARGKRVIMVGGSGFYYQTAFFDFLPLPQIPLQPPVENYPRTWQELAQVDPLRAAAVHPHDQYRIERALTIFYQHNVVPSSVGLTYKPLFPYLFVHIQRTTADLYERINARTDTMLENGWLSETENLPDAWKSFVKNKKIIGYDAILAYQEGLIRYETLRTTIQQKTRQYAKRQRTYFRTLLKKIPASDHQYIHEINLTLSPVDLYLNQLMNIVD